ncbi:DNA mismatch repair protein MutS [Candidatus Desantisbacteria bacterium CG2_30_40_21]|uniref:DNA mismatch repair protein MutS n=4 Tax=unclassified Candidatus Desantisiibacteriota TaxID=3106372 RepID=A0A2M7JEX5_9BACT|nr:MAG: DNA mismatch repair protein MutS [Candidatus Desantisbacteria bacterium CG2_30_40_21]PIP40037.1 MAG: DNA mismatch repair protein MutS [Candidatus Desantisbacteria bacterium CG23_combo_of_CG06-09_8_20_14_all_40_23]PIX17933.1 MAG: DNA mismatch repair protein MutS [Candidatus Desantisbacteria bacterium CG_4_8_14_3_um_filter_40_12]PIY19913.1 MAG: DNA mismatch repair protein MutS [Candidatus Desantisbacteria bacterium CG_4_10_14_3_um_filter_40_18]
MSEFTPMMSQYLNIKKEKPNTILFFRLGDFYEMFFEDAKVASQILNITLTAREGGKNKKVPMCGLPYHAAESYIAKLIKAGKKVAICEQVEDPKTAKGLVKREVVRTITPGTVLSPALLEDKVNNYLVAINKDKASIGLAFVESSTGEFMVSEFSSEAKLFAELMRLGPKECLIPESLRDDPAISVFARDNQMSITLQDDWTFSLDTAQSTLCGFFGTITMDGFGCGNLTHGIGAAGAIIRYLKETGQSSLSHITRVTPYSSEEFMSIDPASWRNLELTKTIRSGEKTGSLIWVLDQTGTAMGGRLLRSWIQQPLLNEMEIIYRQDGVEEFRQSSSLREKITTCLKSIHDLARLAGRIDAGLANARDIIALKESLLIVPSIKTALATCKSNSIKDTIRDLDELRDIVELIDKAIHDTPPLSLREGGIIKSGYNQDLDELHEITRDAKGWILRLQQEEIKRTGIGSLKISYNKVFGYYIEITKANLHLVPQDYIRKQTIANGERFITPQLKEKEVQILSASERITGIEYEIFLMVRAEIISKIDRIQQVSRAIAILDVLVSMAKVAVENDYTRPVINDGDTILLKDARHPVVEKVLAGEGFVPNDTLLDQSNNQILIITGPNMAGKSTYIRQVALIVLMAQIGSFVPAKKAEIGVVDQIFTRVGASDELMKGQSTFMVEMIETANILNNSTPKSLVILDEIGRGTSTFDGVSIAWAVAEYIHNHSSVKARTLFATHYHELTELEVVFKGIKNYNIAVKEWGDKIIFLRKIIPGGADKSYGIHVAKLAGLPKEVILRATEILDNLEMESIAGDGKPKLAKVKGKKEKHVQLDIFDLAQAINDKAIEALKQIDVNNLTPIEALNKLYELKKMV